MIKRLQLNKFIQNTQNPSKNEILEREIDTIQHELIKLRLVDHHNVQTRRELYQKWAIDLEILYENGAVPIVAKDQICSAIIQTIKRQQATNEECEYVSQCLPTSYKRTYEISSTYPSGLGYLPVLESVAIVENMFASLRSIASIDPGNLDRKQHQEYYEILNKMLHKQIKACDDRHIAIVDEFEDSWPSIPSPFDEPIHMDRPESLEGKEGSEFMIKVGTRFKEAAAMVADGFIEYGPLKLETKEVDQDFLWKGIRYMEAQIAFWRPDIDKKWRSNWLLWFKHIQDAMDYGLHASMSKSRTRTSNRVLKVFRGITREEIDAKAIVCLRFFKQFVQDMPGGIEFCDYFVAFKLPYRRDLSVKLNPKLSHQS